MRKKVGIMGGTFDPIHIGHLILGENAYQQFELDEVLFMPSGNPPHKRNREGRGSLSQRIEMVSRAIENNPHFTLSLEEAHEEGYTYTRETLEKLHKEHPDTDYYFIMGTDSLFSFEEWRDPHLIAQLAVIIVAVRDHVDIQAIHDQITHLKSVMDCDIRLLDTPNIDISSHMVRDWIKSGRTTRYYLPDSVISYIAEQQLYS